MLYFTMLLGFMNRVVFICHVYTVYYIILYIGGNQNSEPANNSANLNILNRPFSAIYY